MTLQSTPAWARILSTPEITDRNVLRSMFTRSGAMRPGHFVVAPTGTTRQFSISSGEAFILGQENSQQGGYVAWSDASENLVLAAPSGSPRIDTVLLRVYDEQYGTLPSGTSRAQWDIVQGTPNASPVALPDSSFLAAGANYVPGAWWRLCDIRTNPGDTTIPAGQIYPTMTFAQSPGGIIYCNSVASTTGFGGRPASTQSGDTIYELDTGRRYHTNLANNAYIKIPEGVVYLKRKADGASVVSGLTGTETQVFQVALTGLHPSTNYRILHSGAYFPQSTGNSSAYVFLKTGTGTLGTTQIGASGEVWLTVVNNEVQVFVHGYFRTGSSQTTETITVTAKRITGTATINCTAYSGLPFTLSVEDVGDVAVTT